MIENTGKRYEIGEPVQFEFTFTDRVLSGTAICRWSRHVDAPHHKLAVGLEFIQLDENSINYFLKFSEDKTLIPFIPSATMK